MYQIVFEDNTEIEERQIEYWDNVPRDKRIKNIKFRVPVLGLDWESGPAERYMVTQVGLAVMSGQQKMVGYCVYYQIASTVYCLSVKHDGIKQRVITEDLGTPDHIWRKGTLDGQRS